MSNEGAGGLGFLGGLQLLFVGLKLTDYIDWSWFWVLSPTWMPIIVFIIVVSVVLIKCWNDK